jgi:hypothetical protein
MRVAIADLCLEANLRERLAQLLKLCNRLCLSYHPISLTPITKVAVHTPVFAKR